MMKIANKTKKTIFVGLSGGVDSAVSAALLKDQGHEVVGIFIKTWQPDFIECTWKDERRDAMRIAAHLNIPFITLDLEKEYKEGVADYMIAEYKAGRTPNPDVMCNKEVKFGAFLKFALSHGADAVATGHYAQVKENEGVFELHKGIDPAKDQSYFLWTLGQYELSHVLFPVGNMPKQGVRVLAEKYKLPVASKKDSQGVCFLGQLDMKDFLSHYIETKKGNVLSMQGEIIGTHDGSLLYTLGERHGFDITQKTDHDIPLYVVAKDIIHNTITVAPSVSTEPTIATKLELDQFHLSQKNKIDKDSMTAECHAQVRYHGKLYLCVVTPLGDGKARVEFTMDHPLVSPGQSVVFYQNSKCIGGGVVR